MKKYKVDFVNEPMLYFGEEVNKDSKGRVGGKSGEDYIGFERGEMLYRAKTGELNLKTERLYYREEMYSNQVEDIGGVVEYRMEIGLSDFVLLAEEVIKVDTGVNVEDKVELRTDFHTDRVGMKLDEEDFVKEEYGLLKYYSTDDYDVNIERVVNNYLKSLGYGDGKKEVEVYSESVEDDRLYVYTITAK